MANENQVSSHLRKLVNILFGERARGSKNYQVHLKALNLDIPLSGRMSFSDDGYVLDLVTHSQKWFKDRNYVSEIKTPNKLAQGICNVVYTEDRMHGWAGISYLKQPTLERDIHVRAHEETHFLHAIGKLDYLSQAMITRVGLSLDFKKVQEFFAGDGLLEKRQEIIAELGGIFGVHQTLGFNSARNLPFQIKNDYLPTAWQIYESTLRRSRRKN